MFLTFRCPRMIFLLYLAIGQQVRLRCKTKYKMNEINLIRIIEGQRQETCVCGKIERETTHREYSPFFIILERLNSVSVSDSLALK
jgi:hypothetical protein